MIGRTARDWILLSTLAGSVVACGPRNYKNDNDALRRERVDLVERVEQLEGEISELRIKLAEERRVREGLVGEDVLSAIPRVTSISLGRLSGVNRDGELSVYISPKDGRGRFVQVVGTLSVRATHVPEAGSDRTPSVLVEDVLPPTGVRESYHDGITGLAYVARLGKPSFAGLESGSILLEATFDDAVTGESHVATRTLELPDALAILRSDG